MDKRITELIDQSSTPAQIFNLFFDEDGDRTPDEDIISKHYDTKGKEISENNKCFYDVFDGRNLWINCFKHPYSKSTIISFIIRIIWFKFIIN